MRTLKQALAEQMKNPEFKAEYEALEPEFAIIQAMIDTRKTLMNYAKASFRKNRHYSGRYKQS